MSPGHVEAAEPMGWYTVKAEGLARSARRRARREGGAVGDAAGSESGGDEEVVDALANCQPHHTSAVCRSGVGNERILGVFRTCYQAEREHGEESQEQHVVLDPR